MSQRRLPSTRTSAFPHLPAALVVAALSVGCATSSPGIGRSSPERVRIQTAGQEYDLEMTRDQPSTRHTVEAPTDALWTELPQVYEGLGLRGGVMNARARVFGSPRPERAPRQIAERPLSYFFGCGSGSTGPRADSYEVRIRAVTEIRSVGEDKSEVVTWIEAVARPRGVAGRDIACSSNGRLEALLVDALRVRVGS
ncbi:MAG TPA: hypothetical protein VJ997_00650 [Longimicrobiales bacterium]|nr:hypothetical protein [Longimicrobiales bacterium]